MPMEGKKIFFSSFIKHVRRILNPTLIRNMVYIRLNWNLIEKQISMNSLNCCVRIEGWEKTHLRTWLSRTWSRNFKSVKQCHWWDFHSSVSTFSLHHLYSSLFYCKTLNLYKQSFTKLAKQRTETQLLIWCQYVSRIDIHVESDWHAQW